MTGKKPPPDPGDDDLLATAGYREQSKAVRNALEQARKEEEQASRTYDEARAEMRKSSREEVKKLEKEEKDHASFQKLFTALPPLWDSSSSCSRWGPSAAATAERVPENLRARNEEKLLRPVCRSSGRPPQGGVDGRQGYGSLRPA